MLLLICCLQGASFGYHAGGWGKPPVDEQGKPLYGDVFGIQQQEAPMVEEDEQIESQPWGELESESEEESESEVCVNTQHKYAGCLTHEPSLTALLPRVCYSSGLLTGKS